MMKLLNAAIAGELRPIFHVRLISSWIQHHITQAQKWVLEKLLGGKP